MIYADEVATTTTDKTIECIVSTGERRAVRLLLYVRCGNIINAPDKRYNGMEYVAIIIGIIVGAILNEWTRQKGKP